MGWTRPDTIQMKEWHILLKRLTIMATMAQDLVHTIKDIHLALAHGQDL
jgi:hypothetical protein